ncbi:MAG: PD-(D/E)XK nuclease family protein [Methanobacterium sp.]|nr:PD-(D/E)XK nuclease family protein [Methanobacterium sp.]
MSITLGPSTIASQFWCEMAVDLRRKYGEVSTPEKEMGSEIHKDRFLEVLEEIVVEIKTPGDRLHSNVHNMLVGLELYKKEGLTRELPILAKFDSVHLMGIIDEIREIEEIQKGVKTKKTQIVEMKTRRSLNPPSSQQILRDKMQGMIYWYGLNSMINKETEMGDFWTVYGVDLIENDFNEPILSEEYMKSLEIPREKQIEYGSLLSIGNLINNVLKMACELPELSKTIEIIYIHQKTLMEVHKERYKFDERFFTRGMRWALEYWSGKREPTSVGEANNWKCDFCSYYTVCPAIHKKWRQGD